MNKLLITGLSTEYIVRASLYIELVNPVVVFKDSNNSVLAICKVAGEFNHSNFTFKKADLLSKKIILTNWDESAIISDFYSIHVTDRSTQQEITFFRLADKGFTGDYFTRLKQSERVDYVAWTEAIKHVLSKSNKKGVETSTETSVSYQKVEPVFDANGKYIDDDETTVVIDKPPKLVNTIGTYYHNGTRCHPFDNHQLFQIEVLLAIRLLAKQDGLQFIVDSVDNILTIIDKQSNGVIDYSDDSVIVKINGKISEDYYFFFNRSIKDMITSEFGFKIYKSTDPTWYHTMYNSLVKLKMKIFGQNVSEAVLQRYAYLIGLSYYAELLSKNDLLLFSDLAAGSDIFNLIGRLCLNMPLLFSGEDIKRQLKSLPGEGALAFDRSTTSFILEPILLHEGKQYGRGVIPLVIGDETAYSVKYNQFFLNPAIGQGIYTYNHFTTKGELLEKLMATVYQCDKLGISSTLVPPGGMPEKSYLIGIDSIMSLITYYNFQSEVKDIKTIGVQSLISNPLNIGIINYGIDIGLQPISTFNNSLDTYSDQTINDKINDQLNEILSTKIAGYTSRDYYYDGESFRRIGYRVTEDRLPRDIIVTQTYRRVQ